jgi:hypothetical protein
MLALTLGLGFGLGGELVTGLVSELGPWLTVGLVTGLVFGLDSGLAAPGDLVATASPQAVLALDRRVALLLTLVSCLSVGLVSGLISGLMSGVVSGIAVSLVLSMSQTAWPSYMLTRGWLAAGGQLPWPLMAFLADAHQRGVLRQAGATYQFRYLDLQRRLATRP